MSGFIPRKYLYWLYRPLWLLRTKYENKNPRRAYQVHWIIGLLDRVNRDVYRPPLTPTERRRLFGK